MLTEEQLMLLKREDDGTVDITATTHFICDLLGTLGTSWEDRAMQEMLNKTLSQIQYLVRC
jgi:hypothetical protein